MQDISSPSATRKSPGVSLIAAVANNGAIGFENKLLYWLPNDLKRFKALTTGHTIVMGRRTFESLPKGALPNRRNIVLTKNAHFIAPNAEIFPSLEGALEACLTSVNAESVNSGEVFILGGASVYREALPLASRLCLTLVDDTPEQADAFFPWLNPADWKVVADKAHEADERHRFAYRFIDLERR
ncbi:MAG: dihydrofolate reductase [Bacteroidaceae bacterium]|nr:dihydrofolate reductase [Bacteroidaceae bacterium]